MCICCNLAFYIVFISINNAPKDYNYVYSYIDLSEYIIIF